MTPRSRETVIRLAGVHSCNARTAPLVLRCARCSVVSSWILRRHFTQKAFQGAATEKHHSERCFCSKTALDLVQSFLDDILVAQRDAQASQIDGAEILRQECDVRSRQLIIAELADTVDQVFVDRLLAATYRLVLCTALFVRQWSSISRVSFRNETASRSSHSLRRITAFEPE